MKTTELMTMIELETKEMLEKARMNKKLDRAGKYGTHIGSYAVRQDIKAIRKHLQELSWMMMISTKED